MNVLGLCSYPIESAATRYRLAQFTEPLAEKGIQLEISSFLDSEQFNLLYRNKSSLQTMLGLRKSFMKRFSELFGLRKYDLLLIQREAMFLGPAIFEWVFQKIGNLPLILDLDDATYIRYVSPTYGRIGSFFKFFGKTDRLIKRAETVICGNRLIAEYVEKKGTKSVVIPTVVDTDKFHPISKSNDLTTVGWVGTHSTFSFLQSIFPALENVAKTNKFKLKIVGAGQKEIKIKGVEVENLAWQLEREIEDFQSFDIGLYPMELGNKIPDEWIAGKSGFKAIQYMSVGIPYIVSPIGVCAEIGIEGKTHFAATTLAEWESHLSVLLNDNTIRQEFGESGRRYALSHFTVDAQVAKLVKVLESALDNHQLRKNERQ